MASPSASSTTVRPLRLVRRRSRWRLASEVRAGRPSANAAVSTNCSGGRPAEHRPRLSRCLRRSSGQTPAARFYSLCRTAGTAWSYPYSFACRPLTIAAIVISALSLVSMVLRALNPCALRLPSRRPCPCTELALGLRRYYSVSGRRIISERNGPLPLDPRIPSFSATLKSPRQSLGKYEY